jgi:hypothetical protein
LVSAFEPFIAISRAFINPPSLTSGKVLVCHSIPETICSEETNPEVHAALQKHHFLFFLIFLLCRFYRYNAWINQTLSIAVISSNFSPYQPHSPLSMQKQDDPLTNNGFYH